MVLNHERVYYKEENDDVFNKAVLKLDKVINYYKSKKKFKESEFIVKLINKNLIEDFYNLQDSHVQSLKNIETVCNSLYGDNWNFDITILNSDYILENRKFKLSVSILFPTLTITNKDDNSHLLTDLLVNIPLFKDVTSVGFSFSIYGIRLSNTCDDMNNYYSHSHLKSYDNYSKHNRLLSFCLGSSENPYVETVQNFNDGFSDIIAVEAVFLNLQSFLEYESLEGGPYKKMIDVQNLKLPLKQSNNSRIKTEELTNCPNVLTQSTYDFVNVVDKLFNVCQENNPELFIEAIDKLEVYVNNTFIEFQNNKNLEEVLKLLIKNNFQYLNEEYKSNIILDIYSKLGEFYYVFTYNERFNNFNFNNWLNNIYEAIGKETLKYQLNDVSYEFKLLDLEEKLTYYNTEDENATSQIPEEDVILLNIDNYHFKTQLLNNYKTVLNNKFKEFLINKLVTNDN
jgi:hypothetical protein